MAATYKWTPQVFRDFSRLVLTSEFMRVEMQRRADIGAEYARSTAPRETSHFASSISASTRIRPSTGTGPHGSHGPLVVGVVSSDDPAGMHIELGTKDTPAHNTLRGSLGIMKSA